MNSYDFFIYEFICFMNSYMSSVVPRCYPDSSRMMKQLHWACTARGAHKNEKFYFSISARLPFFCFRAESWPGPGLGVQTCGVQKFGTGKTAFFIKAAQK